MSIFRPVLGDTATRTLSAALQASLFARGIDYMLTSPEAFRQVTDWASPTVMGLAFALTAILGLVGVLLKHPALTAISHATAAAMFFVMGIIGLGPASPTAGWGWRAPIQYILGNGVVQLFAANASYDRWLKRRGRRCFMDC